MCYFSQKNSWKTVKNIMLRGFNIKNKFITIIFVLLLSVILSSAVSAADSNKTADIGVVQTVSNSTPNYNSTVNVTTTVTNNGPDNATGVKVTYKLPNGLTWISDDSNGSYNRTTGIWDVGNLTVNVSKTLNIKTRVTGTGLIENLVEKTSESETDPFLDNDSQLTEINVMKNVDISVSVNPWSTTTVNGTKVYQDRYTVSNTPVFIVTVKNLDGVNYNTANLVVVEYAFGSSFDLVSVDTKSVGTYSVANNVITWNIGTMPKGGSAYLAVVLRVKETGNFTPGLNTTARLVSVNETDQVASNNQFSYAIWSPVSSDIEVKQFVTGNINYLNNAIITITVRNNGPDSASGVYVTDKLPLGLVIQGTPIASQGSYNPTTGVWNIGNLTNNQTVTLIINALINATGTIKNTAIKTGQIEADWNYNNNGETQIITVNSTYNPKVDISVSVNPWSTTTVNGTKVYQDRYTVSNTPVFIVTVKNLDGVNYNTANLVVVEYAFGSSFDLVSVDTKSVGTYSVANNVITWNIGTMPKGGSAYLAVVLRVKETGNFTPGLNTTARLVSVNETDQVASNNQFSYAIWSPVSSDIEVKQFVTGNINYLNNAIITITVRNNGPDSASGVYVTDKLPLGLVIQGTPIASQGSYNPTTGVWNIGNLTNNQTVTLIINALINATGTIKNTAIKTGQIEADWNYNNNGETQIITVPDASDIAVTQTSSNYSPNYLDVITITIRALNNGISHAKNVQIEDILPSGLQYISSRTNHGNYKNGIWTINNLKIGEDAILTITVRVVEACTVTNTASRVGGSSYDYNASNDAQTVNLNITPAADIEVTQSVNNSSPNYMDNVTFTVTVRNNGPDNATGIKITDLLPSGLDYLSYVASKGTYNSTTGVWDIGNVNTDESVTLSLVARVLSTGSLVNLANKTAETTYDYNTSNDWQSVNLAVAQAADVQVTQTVNNSTPLFGDNVTFTVTVKNNGPNTATGVKVTNLLPNGLGFVSYTVSKGSYNSVNGVWDIGNLNNNEITTLSIIAQALVNGNITNVANKTSETTYDYNTTNDIQSLQLNVSPGSTQATNFYSSGTTVNVDDGSTIAITSPFNITLYGRTYNSFYISTNGLISFSGPITAYIPVPDSNTRLIAPFWDDIDLQYGGSVYYTMSSQSIVITWDSVPSFNQGSNPTLFNTFQLRINSDGTFEFIYGTMQWKVGYSTGSTWAGFKGRNSNEKDTFWTSAQDLSILSNHSFKFNSNGDLIS